MFSLFNWNGGSGAHYWGREFQKLGHAVGIMACKFIAPFRKGGKNGNNDAEAICEAVSRSTIWFVPVKTAEQQAQLCVYRVRQRLVAELTALINQLRGSLSEFGIVISRGRYPAQREIPLILEDVENGLPILARQMISNFLERIKIASEQILFYDRELRKQANHSAAAKRLLTILGVGEQATPGVVASVPDPTLFKNSCQFAA